MKGHFRKRGCICPPSNCTCGRKWSFIIDVGKDPKTGKRKQASRSGFNTLQEAEATAAALITDVNKGTFVKESDVLFKDWVNDWLLLYIEKNAPKPGTVRLRQYSINKLLQYFGHLKLRSITEEMYQCALNDLKDKGLSKSTLEGIHTTAKMLFNKAVGKKILKIDPTINAYIKKEALTIIESDEEELPTFFEKEELALFLYYIREKGLFMDDTIFTVLVYTGMRVGELVALKWKNVDFNKQTIHITKTYYNPNNNTQKYQLVPPKTKSSRRKIMVDKTVMDTLKKHKEEQEKIIKHLGNSYIDNDYVFANVNRHPGYPILIKLVESRMARILKETALNSKLTPHSLRHTHTSLLAEAGVGLEEIMERLGHHNDEVTRRVYLHITNGLKKQASDKFSILMNGLN